MEWTLSQHGMERTYLVVCAVHTDMYLDVLEFEHIPLYKSAPNLLIGPSNKELVVVVGLTTTKKKTYISQIQKSTV